MELSYKLEKFEGPLDLLLHLIEKNKIDLQNTVAEEVDQLAEIISFNGGHLTEDGKKYLDQLLAVSPDNYWLNLIKTKEK